MKQKGKRMAGALMKWIKAHFDELQFYSLETYMQDGADIADKYKDIQFAVNLAYVRYDNGTPYFYFIKDAFTEVRGVAWQQQEGGWSHHDDGSFGVAHLVVWRALLLFLPFLQSKF